MSSGSETVRRNCKMEKVITIAVAGYGLRGQCYSQYTLEHPDTMKVVAVADIVREKVDAAKQLFNLPEQMCFCLLYTSRCV